MKRNLIFLVLIFGLFSGCNEARENTVSKPDGLLSEQKMVEILADFQLSEAVVNQKAGLRQDIRAKQKQVYAEAILKKHNLNPQLFWDSYNYYITQPEQLDTIYAQTLKVLEAKLPAAKEAMQKNPPIEPRDVPNVPATLPKADMPVHQEQSNKKK